MAERTCVSIAFMVLLAALSGCIVSEKEKLNYIRKGNCRAGAQERKSK